jgi:four helix bundle protein
MGDFRKLDVWIRAKDLSIFIYKVTNKGVFSKDFGLRDQIRRAAVSISSNIAEGDESGTNSQSIRYFNIAKGSVAEVISQTIIAFEIGYLLDEESKNIIKNCEIISKKLFKLINYRKK